MNYIFDKLHKKIKKKILILIDKFKNKKKLFLRKIYQNK